MTDASRITPPDRMVVGPLHMGLTGDGRETLTVDVLLVWDDEEDTDG